MKPGLEDRLGSDLFMTEKKPLLTRGLTPSGFLERYAGELRSENNLGDEEKLPLGVPLEISVCEDALLIPEDLGVKSSAKRDCALTGIGDRLAGILQD